MILVDTSVWIELLRGRGSDRFHEVAGVGGNEVVICLPVIQEVLQGFTSEASFRLAKQAFIDIVVVENPLTAATFELAVDLYRFARGSGLTVRSSVDCLIAACALRNDLTVFHRDRDYDKLARVSELKVVKF